MASVSLSRASKNGFLSTSVCIIRIFGGAAGFDADVGAAFVAPPGDAAPPLGAVGAPPLGGAAPLPEAVAGVAAVEGTVTKLSACWYSCVAYARFTVLSSADTLSSS